MNDSPPQERIGWPGIPLGELVRMVPLKWRVRSGEVGGERDGELTTEDRNWLRFLRWRIERDEMDYGC